MDICHIIVRGAGGENYRCFSCGVSSSDHPAVEENFKFLSCSILSPLTAFFACVWCKYRPVLELLTSLTFPIMNGPASCTDLRVVARSETHRVAVRFKIDSFAIATVELEGE